MSAESIVNLAVERAKRGLASPPDPLALLQTGMIVTFPDAGVNGYIDAIEHDANGRVVAATVMVLGRRMRLEAEKLAIAGGAA